MKVKARLLATALSALGVAVALAHPGHDEVPVVLFAAVSPAAAAVASPAPGNAVTITIADGYRVIVANGIPNHTPGQFPNRGNPNRITAQS